LNDDDSFEACIVSFAAIDLELVCLNGNLELPGAWI